MKRISFLIVFLAFIISIISAQADKNTYLKPVLLDMQRVWPGNRTINVVFHGNSIPTGYFVTPIVNTLAAYPQLTLKSIKDAYPYAVVNVITTSIGEEQSEQGQLRMATDVLPMKPDILFIDYALTDRSIGLTRAEAAWRKMIEAALTYGCRLILMTPTPDLAEDITSDTAPLAQYAQLIRNLAAEYKVGLVDSYQAFKTLKQSGTNLDGYMAQSDHPNAIGHQIVATEITKWFSYVSGNVPAFIHYDFENSGATSTLDKISNTTGLFSNSQVVSDATRGNVLQLKSTTSNLKIQTPSLSSRYLAISFWFKQPAEEFWKNVIYFTEAGGKHLMGMSKENWFSQKQFCFYRGTVSGIVGSQIKLEANQWYHVLISINNGIGIFYLNGVKTHTSTLDINTSTFTDFYLGSPTSTSSTCFLDDVMFFKIPFSDQEVTNLYNAQKNGSTGISSVKKSLDAAFPNPISIHQTLKLSLNDFKDEKQVVLSVIDQSGRKISEKNIDVSSGIASYIPNQKGNFIVELRSKSKVCTCKIIVTN